MPFFGGEIGFGEQLVVPDALKYVFGDRFAGLGVGHGGFTDGQAGGVKLSVFLAETYDISAG